MPRFVGSKTPPTTTAPYNSGANQSGLSDAISGIVFSDVNGNLHIDQSADGTNWDWTVTHPIVGGTGFGFKQELYAPYYRIRFVPASNGATFRLAARQFNAGRT